MEETSMERNVDFFSIENILGFVVNRTSIVMRQNLTSLFKKEGCDITPEEFAILSQLWDEDGLFQSVINEKTLKDKTTVTRLLERLQKKGLIDKKVDEADRRNYRIYLTNKGVSLKFIVIPLVIKFMDIATDNIDSDDLIITIKTLKEVSKNLNMGNTP